MSNSDEFKPGVYVRERDDKRRRVETRADAVAAKFEGFAFDSDLEDGAEPEQVEDDGLNGVGTLGTGSPSEDATPSAPAPAPKPSPSLFS